MKKRIVWLASYPKSGNTWFRLVLTVLRNPGNTLDLNKIDSDGIFSSRDIVESSLDLDSADIPERLLDSFKRRAWIYRSGLEHKTYFVKIHDVFTYSPWDGLPVIPVEASYGAIYIVRNPLDVAVSLSNFHDTSFDHSITRHICNSKATFGASLEKSGSQYEQKIMTWGEHYFSWTQQKEFPVHVMRYEDMIVDPVKAFAAAFRFAGCNFSLEEITQAVEETRFDTLKRKEKETGFKEKPALPTPFFYQGKAGRGRTSLSQEQIKQISLVNKEAMLELGYLS